MVRKVKRFFVLILFAFINSIIFRAQAKPVCIIPKSGDKLLYQGQESVDISSIESLCY